MPRGPSRPYPSVPLADATKVAQAIRDNNAGRPMNRVLLAEAIKSKPGSSEFRDLITASAKYGFTSGNYNSETIELTSLGERLTKPRNESEKLEALRAGMRNIPLFDQLLNHLNNNKLPGGVFLKNTLERHPFDVPATWSEEAASAFTASGQHVGFVRDVGGSPYVVLEAGAPVIQARTDEDTGKIGAEGNETTVAPANVQRPSLEAPSEPSVSGAGHPSRLQFFVAHGHDKEALQQLKGILDELGIPYVAAESEPNIGRPISQKVKDLMTSCSGGIFIFSPDEEFQDSEGRVIFRPRENVIYELGVASFLYDRRIVILKERSVTFPSDFRDLGYIEFEKDHLKERSLELLRELVSLKAVRLLPGG